MYPFMRGVVRLMLVIVTLAILCGTMMAADEAPKTQLVATSLLGQNEWQAGETALVRVSTTDVDTGNPVPGVSIKAMLYQGKAPEKGEGKPALRASAITDDLGRLSLPVKTKPDMRGAYTLVVMSGDKNPDRLEQGVKIVSRSRIMLSTDKPVYQPGQTIHIRALALRPTTLEAAADKKCVIEVDDSKGNKVFKLPCTSSKFGVFSADFILATEINQGTYTVRAMMEDERTEKAVTVERYVLPKFKVAVTTEKPFYLPKQTVKGKIQADYFFGKPVSGGKIVLKFSTFDVAFKDFAEVSGKTNDEGFFEFEQVLPDYFVGLPLEQGNSLVKIEATITDGAGHDEKATISVPVADQPLRLLAVPEGGRLAANFVNQIYVLATYPDGTPAKCKITGQAMPQEGKSSYLEGSTDELGMAVLSLRLGDPQPYTLEIEAADGDGNTAKGKFPLQVTGTRDESILLRADKAIAKSGDKVALTILSAKKSGNAYIDVIAGGRTMLTRTVDIKNGRGTTDVTLPPDISGTVEVHAYIITRGGDTVRDTRLLYVEPPSDLNIKIAADSEQYRPGGPAKIKFNVTDKRGRGVAAALGISVVDEAVFALQDMKPGLEKVYFLLEKEIATPRYEIHELTPDRVFLETKPFDGPKPAVRRDEAARFLFASALKERADTATPFSLRASNYGDKIQLRIQEYAKRVVADYESVAEAIRNYYARPEHPSLGELGGVHHLVQIGMLKDSVLKDQWGREYVFVPCGCGSYQHSLTVQSLGPDGRKDTDDDIIVTGSPEQKQKPQVATRRFGGQGLGGRVDMFFADGAVRREMAAPAGAPAAAGKFLWPEGIDNAKAFDLDNSIVTKGDEKGISDFKSRIGGPVVRPDVRVRQFFPETMFWNPQVITGNDGMADLTLEMADSITTWRMSAMGSSAKGLLGSTTKGLRVFQDFFVDIDLPVSLTQNDQVSIPIAVYNYLPETQKVRIDLTEEDWFKLDGPATKTLTIKANDVTSVYFTVTAKQIGWHKLTVKAHGTKLSDAMQREIEIVPDGKEYRENISDTLEGSVNKTVNIPEDAIADGSNIVVRIYPGVFSQVIEGLDKIFQMPGGCFEQTSSTTYPNILVLDYLKSTKKITPEIQMKAEGFINQGWQRLVSFEVQGGGFSWFGQPPANKVLTAYGLMEFSDMSKVYEIDERVIDRTAKWLIGQQEKDGSWKPDANYLHEESWGNIQHNEILPTAYITWALATSGSTDPALGKAISYLKENWRKAENAYTLAIIANAFAAADKKDPAAQDVIEKLMDMKKEEGDTVYWEAGMKSFCFSDGKVANLETTGMAAIALMEYGKFPDTVKKALSYIVKSKDPNGTWYSTQATVNCLKALVKSLGKGSESFEGNVTVTVNGKQAGSFKITKDDSDVLRQADAKTLVKSGANTVEISFDGKGTPAYSISSVYYLPWPKVKVEPDQPISIKVDFDRTELAEKDIVTSSVSVNFNGKGTAGMVIIDLGTPPGFQVLTEDLDDLVKRNVFQKYNMTARQAIIYIEELKSGQEVKFDYRMRAKFPIKARAPKSTVYRYYNPEVRADSPPVEMVVKGN